MRGKKSLLALLLVTVLAGAAWWQRTPLLAWYYVRGLGGADAEERAAWIERVARLDAAAVPALLACLGGEDTRACANAGAALAHLVRHWDRGDARSVGVAQGLTAALPHLGAAGQQGALEVAEALVDAVPPEPWAQTLRALVRAGLKHPDADSRVRAVRLTLHTALRDDTELLAQVVPLLRAPETPVRRAALLAVGMAAAAVSEDALLPLLHDPDADVRRLCEGALRGRGLRDDHLLLARLVSDARPSARLEVLDHLCGASDLEPGAWLRRLSQDSSPAVRAAAVRAAASQTQADLRDRLRQMAQDDPSPTVRQIAGHYLRQHTRDVAARP
jgi:HEAT repeat protein